MERFNDAARSRACDSIGDDLNNAHLHLYTGTQPAAGAAATGTELVDMTLPADAMGAASAGVAAKAGTWSGVGLSAGDAGWFRFISAAGARWYDGEVTDMAGDGEIKMASTAIAVGQTVVVTSFSLNQPAEQP